MRSVVAAILACACFSFSARGDFSSERVKRIEKLQDYWHALTQELVPGFDVKGADCGAQVLRAVFVPIARYDEAVFDYRVVNLLTQGVHRNDARLAIAHTQLGQLSSLIRSNFMGDRYCLPGRADAELSQNEIYNRPIEPRVLAYAARGLLSFGTQSGNQLALGQARDLWKTLHSRYKASSGGLVTSWNPTSSAKSSEISHASTIYPWAASGFRIMQRTDNGSPFSERHYESLRHAVIGALSMLRRDKLPYEFLTADGLIPVAEGTHDFYGQKSQVIILGHYAQLLNFLLRAYQNGITIKTEEISTMARAGLKLSGAHVDLLATVRHQLQTLLRPPFVDPNNGQLLNGFFADSNQLVWNANRAFWQQTEFIALLDRAIRLKLFTDAHHRSLVHDTYFKAHDSLSHYFHDGRPIAAVVDADLGPVDEDKAFIIPILGYHIPDLVSQLLE